MKFSIATAAAALAGVAAAAGKNGGSFAVLRFNGKEVTKGRVDPIVSPGKPSAHVHNVLGGSAFSMSATGEDLTKAKCSNAKIKGDNSNYWFPALYFHDPKTGKFESVDLYYFNAYYFFHNSNDEIKAFPLGLNIVAGDAMTRDMPATGSKPNLDPSKGPVNAARFTCPRLNNIFDPPSWVPNSDGTEAGVGDVVNLGEGVGFPDRTCNGKYSPLRADVQFPSCYNPKAGLTNYKENMAYPEDNNGKLDCPEGYIHVPQLFYEAYWDTQAFEGRWEEGKGKQPFVFSSGDVTGYSNHGDFMAGWDEELLQHIIDTCDAGVEGMDKCPGLFYGLNEGECKVESEVDEKVDGTLDKLPGNNPLSGWGYTDSGSSDSGSSDSGENEAPSKSAPRPSATKPASDDDATTEEPKATTEEEHKATTGTPSPTIEAAAEVKTTKKPEAAPSSEPTVEPSAPKPTTTGVFGKPAKSTCKTRTHTVTKTVTITHTAPNASAPTQPADYVVKRNSVRRHAHGHGHLHRHRSHRH